MGDGPAARDPRSRQWSTGQQGRGGCRCLAGTQVRAARSQRAQVAVKCVRTRTAADYTMFLREVEALASLRHPHVLPFLGACLQGPERLWLITEFMEGGTMAAWLYPHK